MFTAVSVTDQTHQRIVTVMALAYIAGVIGLQLPALVPYFQPLSPLNLVVSLILLLLYHTDWRRSFIFFALLAIGVGYGIEVVGVHTGLVFGEYAYGAGLGPHLWAVPPVIGLNWLMLVYCCGSVCNPIRMHWLLKAALAASMMVGLDYFIEPVAVQLDFWSWFGQDIPLQNYVAWWLVSFGLFVVWFALPFRKENRLAPWLLGFQFLFFLGHSLLFWI
ncbi:carotenoid biosynthesis protein [Rudanella paleaurantiibacter]|uniref:Carotenoid biosynthesis protein n=2 Tax=Rudanella paleaurantiibacter TaxID=2614655 RepID=A0A7J5U3I1_9BACT|nr:carotenoid biosynthesis protein [Rudanella paleaurantiibacter]